MRVCSTQRFFNKVQMMPNGCWVWRGALRGAGYGGFRVGDAVWTAHRWAYNLFVCPPQPEQHLHHTCRNMRCCNPQHLEALAPDEHAARHQGATTPPIDPERYERWCGLRRKRRAELKRRGVNPSTMKPYSTEHRRGRKYPDHVVEQAREAVLRCQGNASAAAREVGLPTGTVAMWARLQGWRVVDELR